VKKIALSLAVLLAGCASTPTGPGVLVLPGTGKSFDQFRAEEQECRQYAQAQLNGGSGGTLSGAGPSDPSGRTLQQRYDFAYQQCMYAKGHKIPMARHDADRYSPRPRASAPPPPPPPAGNPPAGVPPDYK
jgi:hypothetical protein